MPNTMGGLPAIEANNTAQVSPWMFLILYYTIAADDQTNAQQHYGRVACKRGRYGTRIYVSVFSFVEYDVHSERTRPHKTKSQIRRDPIRSNKIKPSRYNQSESHEMKKLGECMYTNIHTYVFYSRSHVSYVRHHQPFKSRHSRARLLDLYIDRMRTNAKTFQRPLIEPTSKTYLYIRTSRRFSRNSKCCI